MFQKVKILRAMGKTYSEYAGALMEKKVALALLCIIVGSLAGYIIYNYFKEDRNPPAIHSVNYKFIPPNKISITVNATDPSGVAKVLAEVQGKNYSLPLINGLYSSNITDGLISEMENLPIKIYAFDKLNNCAKKELTAVPNLKEKFLSLALINQVPEQKAEDFYSSYLELIQEIFPKNPSWLIPTLKLYSANSTLFNELYRNISLDPQITMDRKELLSLASQLFLDLGYDKKVKVLIPGSGKYKEEFLTKPTIQTFGNYSIAVNQLGLPKHDKQVLFLIGNASQINPEIVDFEPIVVKDMYNRTYFMKISNNTARDIWLIAENFSNDPSLLNHPDWYLALSIFAQQTASDFCDYLGMKPTDGKMWKIINQFRNWEFNSSREGFPIGLPWVSNVNDKKIAYIYLFKLPESVGDLDAFLQNGSIVIHKGFDAFNYTVSQIPRVYNWIMSKYPNGTIGPWNEDPRNFYYDWLGDRAGLGLAATIGQFFGLNETTIERIRNWNITSALEFMKIAKNGNGIDQFLEKNWKYWDLIKFIHGYGVYNFGDSMKYRNLYLSIAMKAFGIPYSNHGVYYELREGYAVALEDIIFGLPDYILEPLKQGKYEEVLILPGNGFSCIGSPLYGIKQDLAYGQQYPVKPNLKYIGICLPLRGNAICFFEGGTKN